MSRRHGRAGGNNGRFQPHKPSCAVPVHMAACEAAAARVFSACIACAFFLSAATYTVSPRKTSSVNKPGAGVVHVHSLSEAAALVTEGDTVEIYQGVYTESVLLRASGTAGNPIVIRARRAGEAVIRGNIRVSGNHVRIEGLRIDGAVATLWPMSLLRMFQRSVPGLIVEGHGAEIVGNTCTNVPGFAISAGKGARIAGNYIYKCQMGICAAANSIIENNEVERLYNWGAGGDCDYARFFGDNIIFSKNTFHGTDIDKEIGPAHVDCFQTFDNNGESSSNCVFENNLCQDCHQGVMIEARFLRKSANYTFRNNIFRRCHTWAIRSKDIRSLTIVHNLFTDMLIHGIGIIGDSANGHTVRNNIFCNLSAPALSSYFVAEGASGIASHNLLYNVPPPRGFASSANLTGLAPLFIDPAGGDFHISPASPAIDRGIDAGVLRDKDGVARPQNGAFDIGPYEFRRGPESTPAGTVAP